MWKAYEDSEITAFACFFDLSQNNELQWKVAFGDFSYQNMLHLLNSESALLAQSKESVKLSSK